jgi:hypothetical protein
MSVSKLGSWLLGSSGGRPLLGEARVICALAELVVGGQRHPFSSNECLCFTTVEIGSLLDPVLIDPGSVVDAGLVLLHEGSI